MTQEGGQKSNVPLTNSSLYFFCDSLFPSCFLMNETLIKLQRTTRKTHPRAYLCISDNCIIFAQKCFWPRGPNLLPILWRPPMFPATRFQIVQPHHPTCSCPVASSPHPQCSFFCIVSLAELGDCATFDVLFYLMISMDVHMSRINGYTHVT